ncbi:TrbC/VirB2 family protein [Desulforhopalus singaporensis]|uniref:TrbC/VIRB2 family protein n=1 Tax=Desulforhopalus singaporensis TaxID=91360 RepID=A0A1H0PAX6_9BACT|nr:TrbC/VirB2 family protein [Desulforhopalus singaporensis]SDP02144.1 TrbC/VIRB2 family protein [Desulforhopalus singaporensis]
MKFRSIISLSMAIAALTLALCGPDLALADTITEFEGPMEKVMNTLTGPWAKAVAIIMFVTAAFILWFRKEELDGFAKGLCVIVMIISTLAFAQSIIGAMFSFGSGALI